MKAIRKILNSAPVISYLSSAGILADNKLQQAMDNWRSKNSCVCRFHRQKGNSLLQVLFATLIWSLLDVRSISNFCGRLLTVFIKGGKNVIYDFLKRDNLSCRTLRMRVAKQAYPKNNLEAEPFNAFVFGGTLKHHRGKKVAGSSSHYDHMNNKHVCAIQIRTVDNSPIHNHQLSNSNTHQEFRNKTT